MPSSNKVERGAGRRNQGTNHVTDYQFRMYRTILFRTELVIVYIYRTTFALVTRQKVSAETGFMFCACYR